MRRSELQKLLEDLKAAHERVIKSTVPGEEDGIEDASTSFNVLLASAKENIELFDDAQREQIEKLQRRSSLPRHRLSVYNARSRSRSRSNSRLRPPSPASSRSSHVSYLSTSDHTSIMGDDTTTSSVQNGHVGL